MQAMIFKPFANQFDGPSGMSTPPFRVFRLLPKCGGAKNPLKAFLSLFARPLFV